MLATVRNRYRFFLGAGAGVAASLALGSPSMHSQAQKQSSTPLNANDWTALKLVENRVLTGGDRPTHFMRFELPAGHEAKFPVASCFLTRAPIGKEKDDGTKAFVLRPYTPISKPDDPKHIDLAIKIYGDGKLTQYLATLKPGESYLDFKGPLPKIPLSDVENKKSVGMIAGGTGLTPMLQVAEELLRTNYKGKINLIYANVSPNDIMLKDRVDALAKKHSNFDCYYVVDKVPDAKGSWTGGIGYITADMLKAKLPAAGNNNIVLVCGPPMMMKMISGEKVSPKEQGPVTGYLKQLGYNESEVYKF